MASFKVMRSSTSRNSDLSPSIRPQQEFTQDPYDGGFGSSSMTVEGILQETFASDPPATESTLLGASMTLMNDKVWREMKEESQEEEIMTLEDFLAKADVATGGGETDDLDVKRMLFEHHHHNNDNPFQMIDKVEGSIVAFGNNNDNNNNNDGGDVYGGTRGKRARVMVEPLDKAAAQRQRRMIKNRESAARSRERKQAYQVELESLAAKLEEENEVLSKEVEEKRKERYQKLMEFLIPVVERPKQQQPRLLRRIRSLEW